MADPAFPHVDGVRHSFVQAGGLRMHVAEAGPEDGEPVLLLHGWPQHWYLWRGVVPLLSGEYRLVMPDMRGAGWTDAPARGYDKETLAADVLALMDAMGLERVRLAGHDWGGYVGFLLTLFHPERFSHYLALNIIHLWPAPSPKNLLHSFRLVYQIPMLTPVVGPRLVQSRRFMEIALDGFGSKGTFSKEEIDAFAAPYRDRAHAKASSRYYRSFQLRDMPKLLTRRYMRYRSSVPTRVLFGLKDTAMHPDQLKGYERYADDMAVELVEGVGHFIVDQRPQLVAERAREFFATR